MVSSDNYDNYDAATEIITFGFFHLFDISLTCPSQRHSSALLPHLLPFPENLMYVSDHLEITVSWKCAPVTVSVFCLPGTELIFGPWRLPPLLHPEEIFPSEELRQPPPPRQGISTAQHLSPTAQRFLGKHTAKTSPLTEGPIAFAH